MNLNNCNSNLLLDIDIDAYENQPNENVPVLNDEKTILTTKELKNKTCATTNAERLINNDIPQQHVMSAGKDKRLDLYKEFTPVRNHKYGNVNFLLSQDSHMSQSSLRTALAAVNIVERENNNESNQLIELSGRNLPKGVLTETNAISFNNSSESANTRHFKKKVIATRNKCPEISDVVAHGKCEKTSVSVSDNVQVTSETISCINLWKPKATSDGSKAEEIHPDNLLSDIYAAADTLNQQNENELNDSTYNEIYGDISTNENGTIPLCAMQIHIENPFDHFNAIFNDNDKQNKQKTRDITAKDIAAIVSAYKKAVVEHQFTYAQRKFVQNLIKTILRRNREHKKQLNDVAPNYFDSIKSANYNKTSTQAPSYTDLIYPENVYTASGSKDNQNENEIYDLTLKYFDREFATNENEAFLHSSSYVDEIYPENIYVSSGVKHKQDEKEIHDVTPKYSDEGILSNDKLTFLYRPICPENIYVSSDRKAYQKEKEIDDVTAKYFNGIISANEEQTFLHDLSPFADQMYPENYYVASSRKDKRNEKVIYDDETKYIDEAISTYESETFLHSPSYADQMYVALGKKDKQNKKIMHDDTSKYFDVSISTNDNETFILRPLHTAQMCSENIYAASDKKYKQNRKEIYDAAPKYIDEATLINETETFLHSPPYAEQMYLENIYTTSDRKGKQNEVQMYGTKSKEIGGPISVNEQTKCILSKAPQKYIGNLTKNIYPDFYGNVKQTGMKTYDSISVHQKIGQTISSNENYSFGSTEEVKKGSAKKILILPKSIKVENVNGNAVLQTKSGDKHILQMPKNMILKRIPKADATIKTCKEKVRIEGVADAEDTQKCITKLALSSSGVKHKIITDTSPVKTYFKKSFGNTKWPEQIVKKSGKILSNECNFKKEKLPVFSSNTYPKINLTSNVEAINTTLRDPLEFHIPKNPTKEYIMAIQRSIVTDSLTKESKEVSAKNSTRKAHSNQLKNRNDCKALNKVNNAANSNRSTISKEVAQLVDTKTQEQSNVSSDNGSIEIMNNISPKRTEYTRSKKGFILNGSVYYDVTGNEFVIICVYCAKKFPLSVSLAFETHVHTVHSYEGVPYNKPDIFSKALTDIHKNREINCENANKNKDVNGNQLLHVLLPQHVEYVNKDDEKQLLDESKQTHVKSVLHNTRLAKEGVNYILSHKAEGSSFKSEAEVEVEDTIEENRIYLGSVGDNNSQDNVNLEQLYAEERDSIDEQQALKNITRKNRKRTLPQEDGHKKYAMKKGKLNASPVENDKVIFPLDVEEDDIPKPTNGDGIIFGVTNRAVVMQFLQFFKTRPELWRFAVLEKPLDNCYLELEKLCIQLNEKWHLNITLEEVIISLVRITLWTQACLAKALFNAQFKLFSGQAYSEYFDICLQISQNSNIFTEDIKKYLNFRQTVCSSNEMPKNKCKKKDNPIVCDVCGKLERSQILLARHKKFHQPPQIKCTVCPQLFYQIGVMEQHVKSKHLNMLDWMCEICGKMFRCQNNLYAHQKSDHLKIRYACIVCGYTCNNQRNLTTHQSKYHVPMVGEWWHWVHEEPPSLNVCKTGRPALLINPVVREVLKLPSVESTQWRKKHSSKSSTKRFYGCFKCKRRFDTFRELRRHNRALHYLSEDKLLNCKICNIAVQHPNNIVRHYITKHKLSKLEATQLYRAGRSELTTKLAQLKDHTITSQSATCPNETITDEKYMQYNDAALNDIEKLELGILEKLEKLPAESVTLECNMCNFIAQHPSILKEHYFNKHNLPNASINLLYIATLNKLEERLLLLQENQSKLDNKKNEELIVEVIEVEEADNKEQQQPLIQLDSLAMNDELIDEDAFNNIIYEETIEEELIDEYEFNVNYV